MQSKLTKSAEDCFNLIQNIETYQSSQVGPESYQDIDNVSLDDVFKLNKLIEPNAGLFGGVNSNSMRKQTPDLYSGKRIPTRNFPLLSGKYRSERDQKPSNSVLEDRARLVSTNVSVQNNNFMKVHEYSTINDGEVI